MSARKNRYNQTLLEEVANSISHGLGLALSIVGFTVLIILASQKGDPWRLTAYIIYGLSLTTLYLFSTLYHGLTHSRTKAIFRRLDHSAIYLLIAGTYTPVILISLRTTWVMFLLPVVWVMAILGVYMKVFYIHRYERLTLAFYILMGWMALIAAKPLFNSVPIESFIWIIVGGISYTTGIIFYAWRRLPYQHTIWHMFVLLGSISHYIGILYI
jgi:hemolysin III